MEVASVELEDPTGWVCLPLGVPQSADPTDIDIATGTKAFLLQVRVISMHQNGKDCHIRQVKVFGPRAAPRVMGNCTLDMFQSEEARQYAHLR